MLQPSPLALIVDHQLRSGSTVEAHEAARRAEDLGLRARVLTVDWGGSLPHHPHKMHAARDARYALLLAACQREGVHHLLTAHHADDQAETFLLRFIHASGLDGLACISPENRAYVVSHGVRLLRPLLGFHKVELLDVCHELGLDYAEDPTNNDLTFQRNRFRQLMQSSGGTSSPLDGLDNGRDGSGQRPAKAPTIVEDILTLQRVCAQVSSMQQQAASHLLRRATLHAAPCAHLAHAPRWRESEHRLRRDDCYQPRGWIHWPTQLTALSERLGDIPHAILAARHFASVDETVAAVAISTLLQKVAGSEYPPGLTDCIKLAQRLAGGQLKGGFTGGGCAVQPLTRSKGRYMLVVPQRDKAAVLEVLRPQGAYDGQQGEVHYVSRHVEGLQAAAG